MKQRLLTLISLFVLSCGPGPTTNTNTVVVNVPEPVRSATDLYCLSKDRPSKYKRCTEFCKRVDCEE